MLLHESYTNDGLLDGEELLREINTENKQITISIADDKIIFREIELPDDNNTYTGFYNVVIDINDLINTLKNEKKIDLLKLPL